MSRESVGHLYGIGIGPGDPELLTLKAFRLLQSSSVIAYPLSPTGKSLARSIVADYLRAEQIEIGMYFPFQLDRSSQPYYDQAAETLAKHLNAGLDVAVLCEGDPFFYGTFMYLFTRLAQNFPTEVIPGVSSVMASASMLGTSLTYRNDIFMVISAILPAETLLQKLALADAAVIIKLGKHFPKVYQVLKQLGLTQRAQYIERATMSNQRIIPLNQVDAAEVPYFSMIVLPSQWTDPKQ